MSPRKNLIKPKYAYDSNTDRPQQQPSDLGKRVSASSLLSLFKARQSLAKASQMNRYRSQSTTVSYNEPDDSDEAPSTNVTIPPSPGFAPSETSATSEESALSNINVMPALQSVPSTPDVFETPTRLLPARTTRSNVNYATPKKSTTPRKNTKSTKAERILESDTMDGSPAAKVKSSRPPIFKPDTARQRVRDEIATKTKAKRDAYILYHRDHFLPLLPENNYITKLEKSGDVLQGMSPHSQLQSQPKK